MDLITNWETYLRLSEIEKNKEEKKKRIRKGDGKKNVTILEDWWVEDDSSQRIKFFDKNLRFYTRTKRDTLLNVFNLKFHEKTANKVYKESIYTPTNNPKLD